MRTPSDIDRELLLLVQDADPLGEERADTEAALRALTPLLAPERPDRGRRRRRIALRTGLVAVGAAAAAFVIVNVTSSGRSGGAVGPASAEVIVHRARAALAFPAASIVEELMLAKQVNPDGTVARWTYHGWTSASAPFASRSIQTGAGEPASEQEAVGTIDDVYDPATHTIYRQTPPHYALSPGSQAGTELLSVPRAMAIGSPAAQVPNAYRGNVRLVVTSAQAAALRAGTAVVSYSGKAAADGVTVQTDPKVQPAADNRSDPAQDPDLQAARAMLASSRGVKVDRHATLGGKPAIRLVSADGRTTYWVSPATYLPMQVVSRGDDGGGAPAGAKPTVITRQFPIYRVLTGSAASPKLLSLTAQHPDARVDTDPGDYGRAMSRLFPAG